MLLWWKYGHENAKRDREGEAGEHTVDSEFMDLTDTRNREFRYAI
jgi:hypothetical protein